MRGGTIRGCIVPSILALLTVAVTSVLVGMAVPITNAAIDEIRTASAARYLAARIMSGRMPAEDRWDALASIACPTLVVRGTRSNVLSEDVARRMVQTLADGRLMELDAGHNVPLDRPRELADAAVVLAT